ncbi:MAG: hypothetical protein GY713_08050, partial [Actinomycetia bacterium]|nr:hypothetical protein [Actinomycetes bacterium]
ASAVASLGNNVTIEHVVVFKPDTDGEVPASCFSGQNPTSTAGLCNHYTTAQMADVLAGTADFDTSGTICGGSALDRYWCPLDREDRQMIGADEIGVDIEAQRGWSTGVFLPAGMTGRWVLRSRLLDNGSTRGKNCFGLWADTAAHAGQCSTITDPTCVGIYAAELMPVRTAGHDDPAVFYLSEIDATYQNKKLEISAWDLGEGMESVQILDPAGNEVPFTYETDDGVHSGPSLPCNDGNECLWVTNSIFDGRLVRIGIDLSGLPWGSYSDTWFQVQYNKTAAKTSVDWTTWGVRVIGDPIRLVD